MQNQIFFEDVEVGTEIPSLVKDITTRQLVKWAGASEDFNEIHYDKDFALRQGLPGVIIHGRLKAAFLGQLLSDWIGDGGVVKKLGCNYRGMDVPGKQLVCKGKVSNKYTDAKGCYVECEVWTENPEGQRTTTGNATVVLPKKSS